MFRKLTSPLTFEGTGLHSGEKCRLTLLHDDNGLFLEVQGQTVPFSQLSFSGTGRGSDLIFPDGKKVRTCEHVLSALAGMGIWQARLIVEGPEMPALDGCSVLLSQQISENTMCTDQGPDPLAVTCPLYAGKGERLLVALPASHFAVTYLIDYKAKPIGTRVFDYSENMDYLKEIAPARTFALAEDIKALQNQGMALGGSLDNAILVEKEHVQTTGGLRFPDEFVRHKVLDLLGDLAILGRPLKAHILAVRTGHVQHLQLTERLRALVRAL